MHSTKVLVCKQACRTLAVQHASYILSGKGGMLRRGEEGRREHAHQKEEGNQGERIKKYIAF